VNCLKNEEELVKYCELIVFMGSQKMTRWERVMESEEEMTRKMILFQGRG